MILIVMPTYNHGKYIRKAISGVLAQDYTDWHLTIVNNACTDDTAEILKEYTDPRIEVLYVKANIGMANAVNMAIQYAKDDKLKYDAFTWICSDDYYYSNWLSTLIPELKEADLVYSGYKFVHDTGRVISSLTAISGEYVPGKLIRSNFIGITRIWTKDLLDKVGLFKNISGEDYDYWLRCEEAGAKFKYLAIELAEYLVGSQSWSVTHPVELKLVTRKIQEMAVSRRAI